MGQERHRKKAGDLRYPVTAPPPWIAHGWHPSVARVWGRLDRAGFEEMGRDHLERVAVAGAAAWFINLLGEVDWGQVFSRGWGEFAKFVRAALASDFPLEPWIRYWRERAHAEGRPWPEVTDEEADEGELVPEGAPLTGRLTWNARIHFAVSVLEDLALLRWERYRLSRCRWGHYFFTPSRRGPLPEICPLHRAFWGQQRVSAWRARSRAVSNAQAPRPR